MWTRTLTRNANAKQAANMLRGVYVLIIQVDANISLNVGALGKLTFKKGLYAYVGSAQNNLEHRVKRHFRKKKRKYWHIDYLLDNDATKIAKVFYKKADKTEECTIAKVIGEKGEPTDGFGSSDCHCKSHLYRIKEYQFLQKFMRVLPAKT